VAGCVVNKQVTKCADKGIGKETCKREDRRVNRERVGKRGNGRMNEPKSEWEKVVFILAVRQPRPPTNFSFLRENDCTYTYETY